MSRYVARRVAVLVPVLLAVATIVFLMMHFAPGDPAEIMMAGLGNQADVDRLRVSLGLDKPLLVQYLNFLGGLLHGDLGRSFLGNRVVAQEIASRYPATVELAIAGMLIALVIGIPAGIISATRRYSPFDHASMLVALAGISLPDFWLGLLLILVFAVNLHLLPVSGRTTPGVDAQAITQLRIVDALLTANWAALADALKHLVLPATVLGTVLAANIARLTRAGMLEVLHQDFVRTATAKGLTERAVVLHHAFRNALIPVVTIVGIQIGHLLGGAVIVETVFAWPGVGQLLVQAISARDYPIVQGAVLVVAGTFVVANLVVDLLYGLVNPQIRFS